jgi:hypothetical protein
MPTRIVFNGREYSDPAEMPEAVRREYEQALAQFEDANKNGIPDVLENAGKNVVAIQQSSFTINGKTFDNPTDLPPWAKALYEQAMGALPRAIGSTPGASEPTTERRFETRFDVRRAGGVGLEPRAADDPDLHIDPLETTTDVLSGIVRIILVLSAIAVVVLATLIFRNMDESSASQGGRFWVVIAAVFVLGVIVDRYIKISRR